MNRWLDRILFIWHDRCLDIFHDLINFLEEFIENKMADVDVLKKIEPKTTKIDLNFKGLNAKSKFNFWWPDLWLHISAHLRGGGDSHYTLIQID